jgi:exodeoxyribonuclease-1
MTYIFYDTETTGKVTAFDQILQFAAIKTDAELNVLDTFDVRCRLLPYIVPSPGALLVTGTTIADITTCPLSHFEMMRLVHAKMHRWSQGGGTFVGWNNMRFDEVLLRQAYFKSLLPIYQTNTNGNGRADMMRMAQVVSAYAPNCLAIPIKSDGKRAFKLGLMAAANNVALDNAHDALADANATLGIARLIRQRAPALWDALMVNARKSSPLRLLQSEPLMLLCEYFGNPFNCIATPLVANAGNVNEWALFDLQFDPARYLDAGDADLRDAIDGTTKVIRRVSINAQPCLLPIDYASDDVLGGRQSLETYQARAQAIREHPEFRRRISRLLVAIERLIQPGSEASAQLLAIQLAKIGLSMPHGDKAAGRGTCTCPTGAAVASMSWPRDYQQCRSNAAVAARSSEDRRLGPDDRRQHQRRALRHCRGAAAHATAESWTHYQCFLGGRP